MLRRVHCDDASSKLVQLRECQDVKLLFFQYGDFGEAYRRFQSSDVETYREQRASVDFVASLRDRFSVVVVAVCQREHRETLDGNLISIGIGEKSSFHRAPVNQLLDYIAPDLIVCRTPNRHVLRWAKSRGVPALPSFADFFHLGPSNRCFGTSR